MLFPHRPQDAPPPGHSAPWMPPIPGHPAPLDAPPPGTPRSPASRIPRHPGRPSSSPPTVTSTPRVPCPLPILPRNPGSGLSAPAPEQLPLCSTGKALWGQAKRAEQACALTVSGEDLPLPLPGAQALGSERWTRRNPRGLLWGAVNSGDREGVPAGWGACRPASLPGRDPEGKKDLPPRPGSWDRLGWRRRAILPASTGVGHGVRALSLVPGRVSSVSRPPARASHCSLRRGTPGRIGEGGRPRPAMGARGGLADQPGLGGRAAWLA